MMADGPPGRSGVLPGSPAAWFYGMQAFMLTFIFVFGKVCGLDTPDFSQFMVAVRPTWMPKGMAKFLLKPFIFYTCLHGLPVLLVIAAFFPDIWLLRLLVGLVAFVPCWGCNALFHWHKDYCMFYSIWVLVLVPEPYTGAVGLGACCHFILSTGVSKWHVSRGDWFISSESCRAVFQSYQNYKWSEGGPASPALSVWVCGSDRMLKLCAFFTCFLEIILAPATALYPVLAMKVLFFVSLILMHIGIALLHSGLITSLYINNVPTYIWCMFCYPSLDIGSGQWACAVAFMSISIVHVLLFRRMLDDNFPLSQFQLFSWAGWQWTGLINALWKRNTRVVMVADPALDPTGLRVMESSLHGKQKTDTADGKGVYTIWMGGPIDEAYCLRGCLEAFEWDRFDFGQDVSVGHEEGNFEKYFDPASFVEKMSEFLSSEHRIIEVHTGRPMVKAYWVTVDDDNVVTKVIHGQEPRGNYTPPPLAVQGG